MKSLPWADEFSCKTLHIEHTKIMELILLWIFHFNFLFLSKLSQKTFAFKFLGISENIFMQFSNFIVFWNDMLILHL